MAHVQAGNDEARRFYERLGFKATHTYVIIPVHGVDAQDRGLLLQSRAEGGGGHGL